MGINCCEVVVRHSIASGVLFQDDWSERYCSRKHLGCSRTMVLVAVNQMRSVLMSHAECCQEAGKEGLHASLDSYSARAWHSML